MKQFKKFKESNVLVTGGLGFIGSNLARKLIELGANVTIVDALLPDGGGNLFNIYGIEEKVNLNNSDIRDASIMNQLVKEKEYIFNLAAQSSHISSMDDPFTDLDINCRGHLTVLEACRRHNSEAKIVYTGTRSQYGKILYTPVDEKHPINPTDPNGVSKHAGEQYHLLYNNVYGIKAVSLRLTNTYGPRHQMKHSRQGFVGWFVRLAMDNNKIEIYGDGKQLRDLNYVDDVVSALLMVAADDKANGEVFNLGSGSPTSLINLAKLIVKIATKGGYEIVPYPKDAKKMEIGDYVADIRKIKKIIGWEPRVALEEGLRKMIEYYEENRQKYW
jgi:nucleoside-diphosphate-sugar epimerase